MSSSDENLIASINKATIQLNRYLPLLIYVTGIIGNLLNTLVLSRRALRSNPCALLFLVSSVAGLIAILSGLTTRLTAGWAVDLSETTGWLCKIRIFVLFIVIVVLFSLLLNCPLLYCYEANLIGTPAKCYGQSDVCRLYTDSKSAFQSAVERLLFNLCTNLTYLASAMPFYIYTLCGGRVFRNEFLNMAKDLYRKVKCI